MAVKMCLYKCLRKMNSEDGQVYSVYYNFLVLLSIQPIQAKHKQTNCKYSRRITAFSVGITMINQRRYRINHVYRDTLYNLSKVIQIKPNFML